MTTSDREVSGSRPGIEIFDHCDDGNQTLEWLRNHADLVVEKCLSSPGIRVERSLPTLPGVEVSLVSDAEIASVHERFMDDPTPTDVITFQHGEILISLETAARCAAEHGHSPTREILLYLIHGLLHLNGFDDKSEAARHEMGRVQERILNEISPFPKSKNPG